MLCCAGLPAAIYCQHRRWTHVFAAIAGGFLVGDDADGSLCGRLVRVQGAQ